ncbi:hypothetical protein [Facklamia sp. P12937]|uniref:hypothetical protein n=1 Tax=Facklamia sp. P12937 TaxID=3421949 RepID=UPI003D178EA4
MILSSSYTLLLFSAFLSGISESFYSGTLSSWLIKDLNLSQDRDILEHIFSKASIIGLLAALVIGTLSADVLYNYNTDLPFYFSILFSIILIVSVIKSPIKDFKNKKISFKNTFKYSYGEIKTIFKQIMTSKKSIVFILFLLLPKVIDIGPSNQWQAIFYTNNIENIISIMWIIISLSGLVGSLISHRILYKKIFLM